MVWVALVWDWAPGVSAVGPDCAIPFRFVFAVSKGKVAYWGFGGGVGAMLFMAESVRKAGGERPKAEGEKPGMER